ncbi:hypothetical protein H8356DRAFT_25472 [Neocallimastix lanati (nom. inval.)]|uniref:Uncharacterized protein n=1 Tax=Neocallimastix californiae TaxID=1754190 RepID=A0A1Y2B2B3_9FUNG|nr:hypothetical protein H8356DRAFT_25472 [Neocallimastix sp. JGI-2020a]ORY28225.1 hypothetical protein LY90DRAFT_513185 [Neocallimastix californiae]|eukprot:ORY28225.1 hypothetical protein LY90DRAFT_513185 [Neocallimastix californiae]
MSNQYNNKESSSSITLSTNDMYQELRTRFEQYRTFSNIFDDVEIKIKIKQLERDQREQKRRFNSLSDRCHETEEELSQMTQKLERTSNELNQINDILNLIFGELHPSPSLSLDESKIIIMNRRLDLAFTKLNEIKNEFEQFKETQEHFNNEIKKKLDSL